MAYDPSLVGDDPVPGFDFISAYPSPFEINRNVPEVTIRYTLDRRYEIGSLSIWIFDVSGNLVREINDINVNRNTNQAAWDGRNESGEYVASGIYFLHVETGGKSSSLKMAVLNNTE